MHAHRVSTAFIGRGEEIVRIRHAIDSGIQLVSIFGPPGMGASSLARCIATLTFDQWDLPPMWCDMAGCVDRDAFFEKVGAVLGLGPRWRTTASSYQDSVGHSLQGHGRILLVLDGIDPVLDIAEVLSSWIATTSAVLITTSHAAVGAGCTIGVPPLSEAADLFLATAQRIRPAFSPDPQQRETIERLSRLLQGNPRALELVAATWAEDPAAVIQSTTFGVGEAVDAALLWSWEHATPSEQRALIAIAPIRGALDLAALADLSDDNAGLLDRFRAKGWVTDAEEPAMREDVRGMVRRRWPDEYGEALRRHGSRVLDEAERWLSEGRDGGVDHALAQVTRLRPDIEGLCDDLMSSGRFDEQQRTLVLRSGLVLDVLSADGGLRRSYVELVARAIESGAEGEPVAWARISLVKALVLDERFDEAAALCEAAGRAAHAVGDVELEAYTHLAWCVVHGRAGRPSEALHHAEEAGLLFRTIRHTWGEAQAVLEEASWLCSVGRGDQSMDRFDRALVLFRRVSHLQRQARLQAGMAVLLLEQGKIVEAEHKFEDAVRVADQTGAWRMSMIARGYLALLYLEDGRAEDALEMLIVVAAQASEMGDRLARGYFSAVESAARATLDDVQGAEAAWARAANLLDLSSGFGAAVRPHRGHVFLARARASAHESEAWIQQAVELAAADPKLLRASDDARLAVRLLQRAISTNTRFGERAATPRGPFGELVVARDGSWFETQGTRVDLSRRPRLGVLLVALCEHADAGSGAVAAETLVALGWPGEKVLRSVGLNRLRVALSTLRSLGLRGALDRGDEGNRIRPGTPISFG